MDGPHSTTIHRKNSECSEIVVDNVQLISHAAPKKRDAAASKHVRKLALDSSHTFIKRIPFCSPSFLNLLEPVSEALVLQHYADHLQERRAGRSVSTVRNTQNLRGRVSKKPSRMEIRIGVCMRIAAAW